MARTAGDHGDAGFTREPAPRIRHVHGSSLVSYMHEVDRSSQRGVEEAHDVVAREREHAGHALLLERSDNDVGPSQSFGHVWSTPVLSPRRAIRAGVCTASGGWRQPLW